MSENRNYGIIREQGEFMEPVPLTPAENATVHESNNENKNDADRK